MKIDIEVSDELVGTIIRQSLLETHNAVIQDIESLETKKNLYSLKRHEEENLENFKKILKATKVMIGYFFIKDEADVILGKKKKKEMSKSAYK